MPVLTAVVGPELARNIALAGWWVLLSIAVLCFIYIQRYLQDPQRQKLNDEWFAQFEAYQRSRYREDGISWRAHDLRHHFAAAPHEPPRNDNPFS